jgi:HEAT repeat protein
MYRGQDIGDTEELTQTCIQILESGQIRALYDILPYISLIHSDQFLPPLTNLLEDGTRSQKLFAALALGSVGNEESALALSDLFRDPETFSGAGTRSLQTAAIVALGEIGKRNCLPQLQEIYNLKMKGDRFSFRRKRLVISALGTLVQYGCKDAEKALLGALKEKRPKLRAQAATEIGVAYWHAPREISDDTLEHLFEMTQDRSPSVRKAAIASIQNLAQLGTERAQTFLDSAE